MLFSFSHLWQQEELSDVDVLLTAPADLDANSRQTLKLAGLPGHTALLSSSPYLKAQILRWQRKRNADDEQPTDSSPPQQAGRVSTRSHAKEAAPNNNANSSSPRPDSSTAPSKRQLVLALQDASEQPAAMAVLAAMYVVKPVGELLSELSDEQQLQAAMLADMWQLPAVCKKAAGALSSTLTSKGQLSEAATQQLLRSQAVPDSLQPLLRQVLLAFLGNLEKCWADAALQETLLALPLSHMELLLSCDELKVSSEDTVLYTVRRYISHACLAETAGSVDIRQRIQERLGPLIRCQHLSHYWLTLSVLSSDGDDMPLAQLKPQLKQLLLMRSIKPRASITADDFKKQVADAPPSWQQGKRASAPVSSVQLTWELDVGAVRQAAELSAEQGKKVFVKSPCVSPPLGGMAFGMQAVCCPADNSSGAMVGLFATPRWGPSDAAYSFRLKLSVPGIAGIEEATDTSPIISKNWGWPDFFEVGPMAGGWDEVAWAAKGLPASGPLVCKLVVLGVEQVPL